jgi:hypothetical protein
MTATEFDPPHTIAYGHEPDGFKVHGLKGASYHGWQYGFQSPCAREGRANARWVRTDPMPAESLPPSRAPLAVGEPRPRYGKAATAGRKATGRGAHVGPRPCLPPRSRAKRWRKSSLG